MKAEEVRKKIDRLSADRKPFVFAVDFELHEGILIEEPCTQEDVLFRTPLGFNCGKNTRPAAKDRRLISFPEPFSSYLEKFTIVKDGLKRGDSFLTNLTVKTPVETPLTLKEIFGLSTAPYCLYVPGKFVCFSPERFVRISAEGIISTNPMKGTIDASIPEAEKIILSDRKETAEHNTVVDLLRNDLSMAATGVHVSRFRYVEKITTQQSEILQVSSEITGQLPADYLSRLGDIIFDMLPAGSVSGAPKSATVDIIRKAEKEPRGYYTGIFGYFDGTELDSGVIIRFIEEKNGKKYFRSGGGITIFSDAEYEYNEVIEKIYLPFT